MGQSNGSVVGTAIIFGGIAVCCGFHVLATLGGLAALSGMFTGNSWLVAAGGLAIAVGLLIYLVRRGSSAPTATSEKV